MFAEKFYLITDYVTMNLLGVDGLFTNMRIERDSLPEGYFKYSLREGEDDFLSSVSSSVLVNHMGDFICKEELNLDGGTELDIFGDYDFTNKEVDLDDFFGVDIKMLLAQDLDDFSFNFDTYAYKDNCPAGYTREDVINAIYKDLNDKEYVAGIIEQLEDVLETNKDENFLSDMDKQRVAFLVDALSAVNTKNKNSLDAIVNTANGIKEQNNNSQLEKVPEIGS